MAFEDFVRFQNVRHCQLTWLFDNVYHCRKLLETYIKGPDYGAKCKPPFPWVLKLGQSTNPEQKGISLFIEGNNLPGEILVNFHVYMRKSDSLEPLLDEKHQKVFVSNSIWESPLIISNDDFKMVPQRKLVSDFWDIRVEFIWNEKIEPEIRIKKDSYDVVSKLLSLKELGTDLKQFLKNGKFSDIYIRCENEEIPSHKAILVSRCPYFAEMINSYSGEDSEEVTSDLSPTKDVNVLKTFLTYLYTGDIDSLTEDGPLPTGIHKCAQRMKKYDLQWLTSPLQMYGYSRLVVKSVEYEWEIYNLCERIQEGDGSCSIRSKAFGKDGTYFTLRIELCTPAHSEPCISVFLQLEELETGDRIHAICDLSAINGGDEVIAKRTEGFLTPHNSIGFLEIALIETFSKEPHTSFTCRIWYTGEDLTTDIDKLSVNCSTKPIVIQSSPVVELGDGCHGWINLSFDLGQLLKTANHSDCFIVVGDDRLPAHRVILAARSPYFSAVFDAKEKECAGTSKGMEILVEKDIDINTNMMKIVLEEIYTASTKIEDPQLVRNANKLAQFFGLRSFQFKCFKFFQITRSV